MSQSALGREVTDSLNETGYFSDKNKCLLLYAIVMVGCHAAIFWQSIMDIGSDPGITSES